MFKVFRFLGNLIGGILLTIAAFASISLACALLIVFYLFYRLLWLFSGEAGIKRTRNRFLQSKQKLLRREYWQRRKYSKNIDQENINQLTGQVCAQLTLYEQFLESNTLRETRYLLDRYQRELNFNNALRIHDIVNNTELSRLNTALAELLDDLNTFD